MNSIGLLRFARRLPVSIGSQTPQHLFSNPNKGGRMRKVCILLLLVSVLFGFGSSEALAARSGGTLNFMAPYGGDLFGLDPHKSTRVQDFLVSMNVFRSLYRWDSEKNMPVLELAESVKISDDSLVYTFKLRPNVKFHNGRKMTAEDIIWSYNRIASMKPSSPNVMYIRDIKGVQDVENGKADKIAGLKKIDDLTLEMTLENPVDIKHALQQPGTSIVPREEVEKLGDKFSSEPVGCGPFKLVKWIKGSEVIIEKFADFYMEGRPYLDKVSYKIMTEAAARDLAFKAKDLDGSIVEGVNYPEYLADPVVSKNMLEVVELFTRHIGFNQKVKPLSDKRVRQAINYAIPADLIIKKLMKDKAYPCQGWLPTPLWGEGPKPIKYEYNPEKAMQLMKEAGYEKGFTVEAIGTANSSWGTVVYEAILPYLKKLNIELKIQQMEGAAMAEKNRTGDFQMYIWSVGSPTDPLKAMERWKSNNPQAAGNYIAYNNPEYDKILDQAAKERDSKKKMELVMKANAIFAEDAPVWFFNYNKAVMAHQPWVHGLQAVAIEMMYQDMTNVWVDEKSPRANVK
ncbi:MAG: ABC transporter substrate-binding protein [Desulfobacteraceae bacterium]|nr:MAG: ABC transporter substrate-binding protein [Desulfobacteraceae bacterium]